MKHMNAYLNIRKHISGNIELTADDRPDVPIAIMREGVTAEANAAHLASCWNALAGYNPKGVREILQYIESEGLEVDRTKLVDMLLQGCILGAES